METNLNTEIENDLKMYIRLLGEDIQVTFQPNSDLPSIMADAQQLDQIYWPICESMHETP